MLLLTTGALTGYLTAERIDHELRTLKTQARSLAKTLAISTSPLLLTGQYSQIEEILVLHSSFPGVRHILIASDQGMPIIAVARSVGDDPQIRYRGDAISLPGGAQPLAEVRDDTMSVWQPIEGGTLIGWLKIDFSLQGLRTSQSQTLKKGLMIGALAIAFSTGLFLFILARPVRAIGQAAAFARQLIQRRGETFVSNRSAQELEQLGAALNEASLRLYEQEQSLSAANEVLHNKTRELERSNAELEQFAYVASHDLQEPLRMVASYTQLLAKRYRGRLDQDADEFIAFAVDGVTRMQRLIQDLLAYSRVGTRRQELTPIDSGQCLQVALANLKIAIEESRATVTHEPLPTLNIDASQVAQLFQNLIDNAIKFQGEAAPTVHVSARRSGQEWLFSVRDNGIGIEPQYKDRVFVIFQRLHTRVAYPGTGIGLAVCKRIVERHGGRIWVESQAGQGATFFFTMPITMETGR